MSEIPKGLAKVVANLQQNIKDNRVKLDNLNLNFGQNAGPINKFTGNLQQIDLETGQKEQQEILEAYKKVLPNLIMPD